MGWASCYDMWPQRKTLQLGDLENPGEALTREPADEWEQRQVPGVTAQRPSLWACPSPTRLLLVLGGLKKLGVPRAPPVPKRHDLNNAKLLMWGCWVEKKEG